MKITYFKMSRYHELALSQYQEIYNNICKKYKKTFVIRNGSTLKALGRF